MAQAVVDDVAMDEHLEGCARRPIGCDCVPDAVSLAVELGRAREAAIQLPGRG